MASSRALLVLYPMRNSCFNILKLILDTVQDDRWLTAIQIFATFAWNRSLLDHCQAVAWCCRQLFCSNMKRNMEQIRRGVHCTSSISKLQSPSSYINAHAIFYQKLTTSFLSEYTASCPRNHQVSYSTPPNGSSAATAWISVHFLWHIYEARDTSVRIHERSRASLILSSALDRLIHSFLTVGSGISTF